MKIKAIPKDFVVKEIQDFSKFRQNGSGPRFAFFKLRKYNTSSTDAEVIIANHLNINTNLIGSSGHKDRRAITTQVISISNLEKGAVDSLVRDSKKMWYHLG